MQSTNAKLITFFIAISPKEINKNYKILLSNCTIFDMKNARAIYTKLYLGNLYNIANPQVAK